MYEVTANNCEETYYMSIDEDTIVKTHIERTLKIVTIDGEEETIKVHSFISDNSKIFGVFNSENNRGLHFGALKVSTLIKEIENRGYKVE